MRLGKIIGRITLTPKEASYEGGRLLIVRPLSRAQHSDPAQIDDSAPPSLVAYDQLGARQGDVVGFTESAEASRPFPQPTPVDAYIACLIEQLDYQPPAA